MNKKTINPTEQQHKALQKAYSYFNKKLFYGTLPSCLLTISNQNKALGFTIPYQWTQEKIQDRKVYHQIAITITAFQHAPKSIFSTLVHEMVHLWQFEFGTPGKHRYHNKGIIACTAEKVKHQIIFLV